MEYERANNMDNSGSIPFIEKIIFDMDGVITSEKGYWYAAAMTVYEKIFGEMNVEWCEENADSLTLEVLSNDNTIINLKNLGVNSNIDLAYVVYLVAFIGQSKGISGGELWQFVDEYVSELSVNAPELYDYVADEAEDIYNLGENIIRRNGELWKDIAFRFQHWYLGDSIYKELYKKEPAGLCGKKGFINLESPVADLEGIRNLLKYLKEKGYILGIATGRPFYEVCVPLKKWDLFGYFDALSIATYDTIAAGEASIDNEMSLTKPHPFIFLRAALSNELSTKEIIDAKDNNNRNILVVGDAGADILAAKAGNMSFAAVLTGVGGKDSYDYFKELRADIIAANVIELKEYL